MRADIEHDDNQDCCRCCGAVFPTRLEKLQAFKRGVTIWLADRCRIRCEWNNEKNQYVYFVYGADGLAKSGGATMEEALQKLGEGGDESDTSNRLRL